MMSITKNIVYCEKENYMLSLAAAAIFLISNRIQKFKTNFVHITSLYAKIINKSCLQCS